MSEFTIGDVVTVNISRETLFPSRSGFGTMNIAGTASVIDHGERIRYYTAITGVADDFASTDEEYLAASAAFSQSPKPARVGIGRILTADASGFIRGGAAGAFGVFAAVTDGTFTISIDGVSADITGVNFTGDTSLDDVAATLQTDIQAVATGGYSAATVIQSPAGRLMISSGTAGDASSVVALSSEGTGTDVSGAGFINAQSDVATVIDGHTYVDLAGELSAIEARNDDWYTLALTRDLKSVANYQAAAVWIEARKKIMGAFDDSLIALDAASTLDLPYLLQASGYARTFCHWNNNGSIYPEISTLARLATVDYSVPNSAITLKFKKLPGISTVDISTSQRTALLAKGAEIYVSRGGVSMLEEGKMVGGEFIDVIHGVDWMEDAIATDVFGVLYASSTKIPMTDSGAAQIESAVKAVLDQATDANIIARDIDDDGVLLPAYTIETVALSAHPLTSRAQRVGPPVTFSARVSGAIHFATVTGSVTV